MASKKTIAVFGATGAQGGSVARAILESKKFKVRALIRDETRPNVQMLRELGAEWVKGDLNDKASVEAVLKGAYGSFMVTNFWDDFSKEKEVFQITPEAYEKLGVPAVKEVANMCRFYQMKPDRDIELTRRLNPKVKSFSQFVSENQAALKVN